MIDGLSGAEILVAVQAAGFAIGDHPEVTPANDAGPPRHGAKPHATAPGYIHACHECKWKLATWQKTKPTEVTWRPARCYSWRHAGPCARAKAAEDYQRIKEALARHERQHIAYAVLTLDPSAWTGDGWEEWHGEGKRPRREGATKDANAIQAAYRALVDRWTVLSKAIRRRWDDFEYVATVECHRSGWPHLNVVFVCPSLAQEIELEARRLRLWGRKSKGREVARRVFGGMLESAGFGPIAFLEQALPLEGEDKADRLAAYIAKLAGDATGVWDGEKRGLCAPADDAPAGVVVHSIEGHTVGEISKLSQAPIIAPAHFRRLRSSKGFLPPKRRDENMTGALYDEAGRELGRDPTSRLLEAALRADTHHAIKAVRQQAAKIEDKWMIRRCNENSQGIPVEPVQPKIVRNLRQVFEVLDCKERGEPVMIDPVIPTGAILAPMEGRTMRSPDDMRRWLGDIAHGPGMAEVGRRYRLTLGRAPVPPS